jgi:hypothetical protein
MTLLAAGALILFFLGLGGLRPQPPLKGFWWQIGWPLAAFILFILVHFEERYVGGFLVIFWLAIYRAAVCRLSSSTVSPIMATVACAVMLGLTGQFLSASSRDARDLMRPKPSDDQRVAADLAGLGLKEGNRLALVGNAFYPYYDFPYYARIAKLRVVAQIPSAEDFWRLNPTQLESVLNRLASVNVVAIIAMDRPMCSASPKWRDLSPLHGHRTSILELSENAAETNESRVAAFPKTN